VPPWLKTWMMIGVAVPVLLMKGGVDKMDGKVRGMPPDTEGTYEILPIERA